MGGTRSGTVRVEWIILDDGDRLTGAPYLWTDGYSI